MQFVQEKYVKTEKSQLDKEHQHKGRKKKRNTQREWKCAPGTVGGKPIQWENSDRGKVSRRRECSLACRLWKSQVRQKLKQYGD